MSFKNIPWTMEILSYKHSELRPVLNYEHFLQLIFWAKNILSYSQRIKN